LWRSVWPGRILCVDQCGLTFRPQL
jgi:hypothetical protein